MLTHLMERGYKPGGGLISPHGVFYLNIPKNASTYLTNRLLMNGWKHTDVSDPAIKECIVVLRDPVERWISGFATYTASWLLGSGYGSDHFREDYNPLVERIIFDTLVFDDHTTEQLKFVEQLPKVKTTFFKLNFELIMNLEQFLGRELVSDESLNANLSENNYDTKQISSFMQYKIEQDPLLKAKIFFKYSEDYSLFNSENFYIEPRL